MRFKRWKKRHRPHDWYQKLQVSLCPFVVTAWPNKTLVQPHSIRCENQNRYNQQFLKWVQLHEYCDQHLCMRLLVFVIIPLNALQLILNEVLPLLNNNHLRLGGGWEGEGWRRGVQTVRLLPLGWQHMTPSLSCSGLTSLLKPGMEPELETIEWREDDQIVKDRKRKSFFVCADLLK